MARAVTAARSTNHRKVDGACAEATGKPMHLRRHLAPLQQPFRKRATAQAYPDARHRHDAADMDRHDAADMECS
jgi:hypothetical protein